MIHWLIWIIWICKFEIDEQIGIIYYIYQKLDGHKGECIKEKRFPFMSVLHLCNLPIILLLSNV